MIESFFRMKSTAKQKNNLNFKRNSYIPKMSVDPCPVGSTTIPFARHKIYKLFPVSPGTAIVASTGYLISPHVAHGPI